MFLGHYGIALAAKRASPRTSLGATVLAAQFLDELWPILLLAGIEHVRIVPGLTRVTPLDFAHYPWSHSLLMALVWAAVIGGVSFALRRDARSAWVLAACVASHWLLDLPMHRPDLPLWPGASPKVGLGLWRSIPATLVIEFGVLAVGLAIYLRTTRARDAIGRWGLWAMIALLMLIYLAGFAGSPPPSERALAVTTLGLWLFVPWGWWVDRHRTAVSW